LYSAASADEGVSGFWSKTVELLAWHAACSPKHLEGTNMLWTIAVILGVMWLLGMVSSTTFGGFLHLLLVLAVAAVLISLIQGRRVV
jgi:hypothetical protein